MPMNKNYNGSLFPPIVGDKLKPTFSDVWQSAEEFIKDYEDIPIPNTITNETAATLFYLLYGKFGNDVIASSDTMRFKVRLFSLVYQYAPTWEKRLQIQEKLRSLTDDEIAKGSVQIYNDAENPTDIGEATGTEQTELLKYINRQNVTHNKKGKLESYALLDSLLRTDVTEQFLAKFKPLFSMFVNTNVELSYY